MINMGNALKLFGWVVVEPFGLIAVRGSRLLGGSEVLEAEGQIMLPRP